MKKLQVSLRLSKNKNRKQKPDDLKLAIPYTKVINGKEVYFPCDEGKIVMTRIINYSNGQMHHGRIYTYHPTKGWRSRGYKEFKPYSVFTGITSGAF